MNSSVSKENTETKNNQNSFLNDIKIETNKEKTRLLQLKKLYDEGEISELDISEEDAEKILELYDKEIKEIRADTKNIKNRIKKEMKNLK